MSQATLYQKIMIKVFKRIYHDAFEFFLVCCFMARVVYAVVLARWRTRRYLRRICRMPKRVLPTAPTLPAGGWTFHRPVAGAITQAGAESTIQRGTCPDAGAAEADPNDDKENHASLEVDS